MHEYIYIYIYAILHMQMLCNGMGQSMHSLLYLSLQIATTFLLATVHRPASCMLWSGCLAPSSFNQSLHASIHRPVDFHRILHRILLTFLLLFCSYIPLRSICLSHASQASILFFFWWYLISIFACSYSIDREWLYISL